MHHQEGQGCQVGFPAEERGHRTRPHSKLHRPLRAPVPAAGSEKHRTTRSRSAASSTLRSTMSPRGASLSGCTARLCPRPPTTSAPSAPARSAQLVAPLRPARDGPALLARRVSLSTRAGQVEVDPEKHKRSTDAGAKLTFKNTTFHRIIPQFMVSAARPAPASLDAAPPRPNSAALPSLRLLPSSGARCRLFRAARNHQARLTWRLFWGADPGRRLHTG